MKRVWKSFLVASAIAVAALAPAASASAAPIISIDPPSTGVSVGDTFTLEVRITDVVALVGYQFSLAFDPAVLSVQDVSDGAFLAGPAGDNIDGDYFFIFAPENIDNTAGTVSPIAGVLLTPLSGISGNGVLAIVHFTALGPGTSAVTPFFAGPLDVLFDINTLEIETGFAPGSVTVRGTTPPVPEPASMLTLALGLGTALVRRRRQTPAATR